MAYEALAQYVKDRKDFCDNEDRSEMEEKWAQAIRAYNNFIKPSYSGHTKLHVPESFATTFRIFSAFNADIRSNPELARYIPYPKKAEMGTMATELRDAFQTSSNYYLNKSNVLKDIANVLLEAVTLGTAHTRTTWDPDTDSPIIRHRPLENIRVDPKIIPSQKLPHEGDFVIDTSHASFDTLRQKRDKFTNLDKVYDKFTKRSYSQRNDTLTRQAYDTSLNLGMTGVEERDRQADMVIIDDYCGIVPKALLSARRRKTTYDDSDLTNYVLAQVIMAEGIPIYAEESPYPRINYDVFRCYPRTNFYYGVGVPELIRDPQRILNGIVNQRLDNVSLILNKQYVYRAGMVNPKLLVSRPGGAIPVTGDVRTSITTLDTENVTQNSYQEQEVMSQFIQKATGAADIFFGVTNPFNETATEVQTKTELGAGMLQEIIAGMVRDGFIPLMNLWKDIILDFQTEPITTVVDGRAVSIDPEDYEEEYLLIPSIGDKMFTKPAEFNKAMIIYNLGLQSFPYLMQQGKKLDLAHLFEKVYTNAGYKDYDAAVTDLPQQGGVPGGPQAQQEVGAQGVLGGPEAAQGAGGINPELLTLIGGGQ